MPIDSSMPAFMKVARMPEAAPRSCGWTLLMIALVFGAANRPEPMPLSAIRAANSRSGS